MGYFLGWTAIGIVVIFFWYKMVIAKKQKFFGNTPETLGSICGALFCVLIWPIVLFSLLEKNFSNGKM